MLSEICAEIRNYFCLDSDRIFDDFAIKNGELTPSVSIEENQYYRIIGSVFNDGVHKQGEPLTDEPSFRGAVWKMRVPQAVIDLAAEVEAWQEKNGKASSVAMSPFQSESFGGYSYSKGSGGNSESGASVPTWQSTFANRLNQYRRIRTL